MGRLVAETPAVWPMAAQGASGSATQVVSAQVWTPEVWLAWGSDMGANTVAWVTPVGTNGRLSIGQGVPVTGMVVPSLAFLGTVPSGDGNSSYVFDDWDTAVYGNPMLGCAILDFFPVSDTLGVIVGRVEHTGAAMHGDFAPRVHLDVLWPVTLGGVAGAGWVTRVGIDASQPWEDPVDSDGVDLGEYSFGSLSVSDGSSTLRLMSTSLWSSGDRVYSVTPTSITGPAMGEVPVDSGLESQTDSRSSAVARLGFPSAFLVGAQVASGPAIPARAVVVTADGQRTAHPTPLPGGVGIGPQGVLWTAFDDGGWWLYRIKDGVPVRVEIPGCDRTHLVEVSTGATVSARVGVRRTTGWVGSWEAPDPPVSDRRNPADDDLRPVAMVYLQGPLPEHRVGYQQSPYAGGLTYTFEVALIDVGTGLLSTGWVPAALTRPKAMGS